MKSAINKVTNNILGRGISTTVALRQQQSLVKLKRLQADYQKEDGRPIHMKGGFCDRILYSSTIMCCYIGILMTFITIYDLAKPPSWKNKTS